MLPLMSPIWKTLTFSRQKYDFKIMFMSYDKKDLIRAQVLLNLLNLLQKR